MKQIILFVDDRVLAAHQQQALIVTHTADFIGIHSSRPAVCRLSLLLPWLPLPMLWLLVRSVSFAENFERYLVCTVLVTAEVKQGVTVSDYAFPIVFEQAF